MSVIRAVDALPTSGLTITALQLLDRIVPGQWVNTTSFEDILREVSGETKLGVNNALRERAIKLEAGNPRYGQAVKVFTLVDTVDQVAAGAAMASKIGAMFGGLGFLEKFTPKPATSQAIDAGLKLVAEAIAFGLLEGRPTEGSKGLTRFAAALEDYARFDLIRLAGWVVFDGMLPLGPAFVDRVRQSLRGAAAENFASNKAFQALGSHIPGKDIDAKRGFVVDTLDSAADWVTTFVKDKGISQDKVTKQISGALGMVGGGAEVLAAAIDASTNYTAHTGTQTVARALARHAQAGMKEELWRQWVDSRA